MSAPEKLRVEVAIALVFRGERVLVSQRPAGVHLPGAWEFPGGKLRRGESAEACAAREVLEEVGCSVVATGRRPSIVHEYEDRVVTLHPIDCAWVSGEPAALEVAAVRWVELEELRQLTFPAANAPLLAALLGRSP